MATFTEWLREQESRDDIVGDLAKDMKRDKNWHDPATLADLKGHVGLTAAKAAEEAWKEWKRDL